MQHVEFIEFLKTLDYVRLMELSKETENSTFETNSNVRFTMSKFNIDSNGFISGLILMRHYLLSELTRRYFNNIKP
jgi:hypothetical protein